MRFRACDDNALIGRDKSKLDIFWLKDDSLEDSENLSTPEVLAAEIAENPEAALKQFGAIYEDPQVSNHRLPVKERG